MTRSELKIDSSDEELMAAFKVGEIEAFNILYSRYSGKLFGYLMKRISDQELCREIFQDVFLKLCANRSLYKCGQPFAPWFFCIARNVLIDLLRKARTENQVTTSFASVENAATPIGSDIKFHELICSLTEREQKILSLKYQEDFNFEKISQKLGMTSTNVRQIASRAIKFLKGSSK